MRCLHTGGEKESFRNRQSILSTAVRPVRPNPCCWPSLMLMWPSWIKSTALLQHRPENSIKLRFRSQDGSDRLVVPTPRDKGHSIHMAIDEQSPDIQINLPPEQGHGSPSDIEHRAGNPSRELCQIEEFPDQLNEVMTCRDSIQPYVSHEAPVRGGDCVDEGS